MSALRRTLRRSPIVRYFAIVCLIVVAGMAGLLGVGSLSNLWADYQDSPTATYLLVGLPALALCLASLAGAVQIWRDG